MKINNVLYVRVEGKGSVRFEPLTYIAAPKLVKEKKLPKHLFIGEDGKKHFKPECLEEYRERKRVKQFDKNFNELRLKYFIALYNARKK